PRQARDAQFSNSAKSGKKVGGGEYPQYTRPEALTFRQKCATIRGVKPCVVGSASWRIGNKNGLSLHSPRSAIKTLRVPKVLLSGNHQKIQEWRRKGRK
ncbi:MAG: hypothetical protein NTY61_01465, partial [Candidatus Parcubacteria bacterium]|nr:hypothetical protein [Candidatus Parcubacteria bacterium]